jgi:hypothetical protein
MPLILLRRTTIVAGPSSSTSSSGGHGLSGDEIIGIVFGIITAVGIALAAVPTYFRIRRREWPFRWWPAGARPLPVGPPRPQQQQRRHGRRRDPSSSGTSGSSSSRASRGGGGGRPMAFAPSGAGGVAVPARAHQQPAELEATTARR